MHGDYSDRIVSLTAVVSSLVSLDIQCPARRTCRTRFIPRTVLVDLDANKMFLGNNVIDFENVVYGHIENRGIWPIGYNTTTDILDKIAECVQREAEACDSMQGIQIVHSLDGGIGGGLSSQIAQRLSEEHYDKILKFYSILPTPDTMTAPQVYNSVLTLQYLKKFASMVIFLDHSVIRELNKFNAKKDVHTCTAKYMSNITTCLRFPCQAQINLRKLQTNIVPQPELKFFIPGYVETDLKKSKQAVLFLMQRMFDKKNILVDCKLADECFLTAAAIFKGSISPKHVNDQMLQIQKKYKKNFDKSIPCNTLIDICNIPLCCKKWSVTLLLNTTAIQQMFQSLLGYFQINMESNAYLHWYTEMDMNKADFIEAQNDLTSLVSSYKEQCS